MGVYIYICVCRRGCICLWYSLLITCFVICSDRGCARPSDDALAKKTTEFELALAGKTAEADLLKKDKKASGRCLLTLLDLFLPFLECIFPFFLCRAN